MSNSVLAVFNKTYMIFLFYLKSQSVTFKGFSRHTIKKISVNVNTVFSNPIMSIFR